MVAPATQYGIKGFLWYQGEANAWHPGDYRSLMVALIADWRKKWHRDDLPFLYVQLPNFMEAQYSPAESQWAEIREAQLQTLSVPNTAMVVAIDAGEWNDIHPLDKKDVGDRLALAACLRGSRELLTKQEVARIAVPVLIAVGTMDEVAGSAHALGDIIPGSEVLDIPDRDHMRAVGDKVFKTVVPDFLSRRP